MKMILGVVFEVFVVAFVASLALSLIGFIGTIPVAIYIDNNHYAFYDLSLQSGTVDEMVYNLESYLETIEDMHGYSALFRKNPSTDIDVHKKIVLSQIERLNEINEDGLATQFALGSIQNTIRDSRYTYYTWYLFNDWSIIGLLAKTFFWSVMSCIVLLTVIMLREIHNANNTR